MQVLPIKMVTNEEEYAGFKGKSVEARLKFGIYKYKLRILNISNA